MSIIARITAGCLDLEHEDGRPVISNFEMPKEIDDLYQEACQIGAMHVSEFVSQEAKDAVFNEAWNRYIQGYIDVLESEGMYVKKAFDPNNLSGTTLDLTI